MGDAPSRINRYLSDAGLGSRRDCEELVRAGRVQIEGETVQTLSARVEQGQVVTVDGRPVHTSRRTIVIVLNKPPRVLTSTTDPEGRRLAIDLVRPMYGGRLFAIGRLDYLSSGLLLFTNDGDLAQRLMRPVNAFEREYVVETRDAVSDEVLLRLKAGIRLGPEVHRIASFHRHTKRRLTLVLTEGRNREIRRMLEHEAIGVTRIYRTRYGSVRLGQLAPGQARFLSTDEIARLDTSPGRAPSPPGGRRPGSARSGGSGRTGASRGSGTGGGNGASRGSGTGGAGGTGGGRPSRSGPRAPGQRQRPTRTRATGSRSPRRTDGRRD